MAGAFLPKSTPARRDWGEPHRIGAELPNAELGATNWGEKHRLVPPFNAQLTYAEAAWASGAKNGVDT